MRCREMTDQRHYILWAGVVVLTLLLPPVTRDGNDYLWNNVHNFTDGHKVWANKGLIYQSWMPFDWKPAVTCCCSVNQKGKENKNTRGLPFNNYFFGGGFKYSFISGKMTYFRGLGPPLDMNVTRQDRFVPGPHGSLLTPKWSSDLYNVVLDEPY